MTRPSSSTVSPSISSRSLIKPHLIIQLIKCDLSLADFSEFAAERAEYDMLGPINCIILYEIIWVGDDPTPVRRFTTKPLSSGISMRPSNQDLIVRVSVMTAHRGRCPSWYKRTSQGRAVSSPLTGSSSPDDIALLEDRRDFFVGHCSFSTLGWGSLRACSCHTSLSSSPNSSLNRAVARSKPDILRVALAWYSSALSVRTTRAHRHSSRLIVMTSAIRFHYIRRTAR